MGTGELQRPLRLRIRLVQAASEEIRRAQPDHIVRGEGPAAHDLVLPYGLLEQRQRLGKATSQSIRVPHACSERVEPVAEVVALAHDKAPLEYRNGLRESALTEGQLTHPKGGYSKVEGPRTRFRQTENVCTHTMP